MKKLFILFAIFTIVATTAQSVGINADGSAANTSAMLCEFNYKRLLTSSYDINAA
jgi:hypothetical protein